MQKSTGVRETREIKIICGIECTRIESIGCNVMLEIIARLFLANIRLILYEFRNLVLRTDKEGILY